MGANQHSASKFSDLTGVTGAEDQRVFVVVSTYNGRLRVDVHCLTGIYGSKYRQRSLINFFLLHSNFNNKAIRPERFTKGEQKGRSGVDHDRLSAAIYDGDIRLSFVPLWEQMFRIDQ